MNTENKQISRSKKITERLNSISSGKIPEFEEPLYSKEIRRIKRDYSDIFSITEIGTDKKNPKLTIVSIKLKETP